jgi:hypothetical protein
VYGLDLADVWCSGRHRKLLNLIDHLPGHSEFIEAYANDPEVAKEVASGMRKLPDPSGPRLTDFTPEVAALVDIKDELRGLNHTLLAVNGNKPPKFAPAPRPTTLFAEAMPAGRKKSAERNAREIFALVESARQESTEGG